MTIFVATAIGAIAAVIMGLMMPVKQDGGLKRRVIVGIVAAILGSVAASVWAGGNFLTLDARSSLIALIAAIYTLFAHQCIAVRYQ